MGSFFLPRRPVDHQKRAGAHGSAGAGTVRQDTLRQPDHGGFVQNSHAPAAQEEDPFAHAQHQYQDHQHQENPRDNRIQTLIEMETAVDHDGFLRCGE